MLVGGNVGIKKSTEMALIQSFHVFSSLSNFKFLVLIQFPAIWKFNKPRLFSM